VRRVYCYFIIFLAISLLFPVTPRVFFSVISILYATSPLPLTAPVEKQDQPVTIPSAAGAESTVPIDAGIIYMGDDGGVGLVYTKEFIIRSVGSNNILSLNVAGMVAVSNDDDSADYRKGFYTNKLYINGNYIDNLNNYIYQEEDKTFRTILVPLPSHVLLPGVNKLVVAAIGPKGGNHDDFALREIKLLQW